ncbi:MAG: guanylate kinase [Coprobacillus sp.]|nr:guanylate kinase [Coprobacillus sp.]
MVVLAGASASGKTEVAKLLASKYGITKVITTTTRPKRVGEIDGVDYFFVTREMFDQMISNDEFVEYTVFNDNYYGSTKSGISLNKCVVIDPKGLRSYIALNDPSIITFFLQTDEATRFERMMIRGDNNEDAKKRIIHDRTAFDPTQIATVDFVVNSQTQNVEQVTYQIYTEYVAELKRRGLSLE